MKIIIPHRLAGLNDYIKALNNNRYQANCLKQEQEQLISLYLPKVKIYNKIFLKILYVEKNRKRDLDNIAFAKKFIQDAMVKKGLLKNDGWGNIAGFEEKFEIDKNNPRIEIEIVEIC